MHKGLIDCRLLGGSLRWGFGSSARGAVRGSLGNDMRTVEAGSALATGMALADLDEREMWGRYLALGGIYSYHRLCEYINGRCSGSAHEHDVAAYALNEYLADRGMDHPVRYSQDL